MKVALACDHGGVEYKEIIKDMLTKEGHIVEDFGTFAGVPADYPDMAEKAAKSVSEGNNERGIVICGTGIGVSMTANKVDGIRCSLCSDPVSAKLTREHNNANVLAMGQRVLGVEVMKEIVNVWVNTPFSNEERHQRRIDKIMAIEKK